MANPNKDKSRLIDKMLDHLLQGYGYTEAELIEKYELAPDSAPLTALKDAGYILGYVWVKRVNAQGANVRAKLWYIDNCRSDVPGLDMVPSHDSESEFEELYEDCDWQQGYYLMWSCPAKVRTRGNAQNETTGTSYCNVFHKIDMGDELLTRPKVVRCKACGRKYTLKPREL